MNLKLTIAKCLGFIPDSLYSKTKFAIYHKKLPRKVASNFSEKLLQKKCGRMPESERVLRELVSDRWEVRQYIESKNSNVTLIPSLWHGELLTQDVWDSLPVRFVIKARHGSQMVLIVDKKKHSYDEVFSLTEEWKRQNYYLLGREWVYKNTPRHLVVEQFITFNSEVPPDYKFFCFNGRVELVQVDLDRFNGHSRNMYDPFFNKLPIKLQYPIGNDISKPKLFEKAVEIAQDLSKDFDFIRVDLYLLDDVIYFGELTNFPGNGLETFTPHSYDSELGSKFTISG
ncbi:ATP-grasp fold amidoligase family protein [Vibrio owensii]|uniref:ATP-grasp fold amidoligase family protein n=1 Tax=Vibrio owensii TaxID=696485 RepID=UPI00215C5A39|nr:ATP-grasp fold amidoligase family protein [Vibrio owensii]MCR9944550.1 hypothetical protein [Vibrio owensii]